MTDDWDLHDRRAAELIHDHPHATELLSFYRHVLAQQRTVYEHWMSLDGMRRALPVDSTPMIDLSSLPPDQLVHDFREFIPSVRAAAPSLTSEIGAAILDDDPASVLQWFISGSEGPRPLESTYSPLQVEFYPRAFLNAVLRALVRELRPNLAASGGVSCPGCGALPQLSVLRDESDVSGQRRLVCSLCCIDWRFPRMTCPNCREVTAENLVRHENDMMPHVTVDECTSCARYVKSIDMRQNGRAVPLVDEIATVELDLWAAERGLKKIRANLLGL